MKMKISAENLFNTFLLVFVVYVVTGALDFPFRAKLLPLLCGIPAIILLSIVVFRGFFTKNEGDAVALTEEESKRQKTVFLVLVGLLASLLILGLSLGLAVFLCVTIRFVAKQKWWLAIVLGAGMYAVVFGLFDMMLHYRLFQGYLLGLILP